MTRYITSICWLRSENGLCFLSADFPCPKWHPDPQNLHMFLASSNAAPLVFFWETSVLRECMGYHSHKIVGSLWEAYGSLVGKGYHFLGHLEIPLTVGCWKPKLQTCPTNHLVTGDSKRCLVYKSSEHILTKMVVCK